MIRATDLAHAARRAGGMQRATLVIDLEHEARREPFVLEDVEGSDDAVRARACVTWLGRMQSEHVSARVFAALFDQALALGFPSPELARLAAMIGQELEHGVLCARAVIALGGTARAERAEPLPEVPRHEDAEPLEALLRNVLSVSCLHETVAVALVGSEREHVGPAALRRCFTTILADEVKHARFGWALVARLAPALDARVRERLGAYLVGAFEHLSDYFAPLASLPHANDAELRLGASDGPANWRLATATVEEVIIPGLERYAIPASAAWRAAQPHVPCAAATGAIHP